jgi:hypothetical protein
VKQVVRIRWSRLKAFIVQLGSLSPAP